MTTQQATSRPTRIYTWTEFFSYNWGTSRAAEGMARADLIEEIHAVGYGETSFVFRRVLRAYDEQIARN